MNEKFVRIFKKLDVNEIKEHLLVYGDLGGNCSACQKMDITFEATHCPGCQTEFKYIAFRNPRVHMPKLQKLHAERPQVVIVDCEDYNHHIGALKAQKFLKS